MKDLESLGAAFVIDTFLLLLIGIGPKIAREHSSLKERAGVKRGFGLRFRGGGGICRACWTGPVAVPFSAQVPCSCERVAWVQDRAEPGRRSRRRRRP
jgi:hypothetical protein